MIEKENRKRRGSFEGGQTSNCASDTLYYLLEMKDLLIRNGYEELTDYWFPTVACSSQTAFEVELFLRDHPQFDYLREFLKDRLTQLWTIFTAKPE